MVFKDSAGTEAGVPLYIANVEKENGDVYLYTVYFRSPATAQWTALCPADETGKNRAMAIPVKHEDWTSDASRTNFTFSCNASGVGSKCVRYWGYKPWNPRAGRSSSPA